MWADSTAEGESCFQISTQGFNFFDVLYELIIDSLLDFFSFSFPGSSCLFTGFWSLGSGFRSILQLVLGVTSLTLEMSFVNVSSDTIKGNFGWCGNHVCGIDSFKWDPINGIWASHQNISRWQALQSNSSSSSVRSREKNDNGARGDRFSACAGFRLVSFSLEYLFLVISGVPGLIAVSIFSFGLSTVN